MDRLLPAPVLTRSQLEGDRVFEPAIVRSDCSTGATRQIAFRPLPRRPDDEWDLLWLRRLRGLMIVKPLPGEDGLLLPGSLLDACRTVWLQVQQLLLVAPWCRPSLGDLTLIFVPDEKEDNAFFLPETNRVKVTLRPLSMLLIGHELWHWLDNLEGNRRRWACGVAGHPFWQVVEAVLPSYRALTWGLTQSRETQYLRSLPPALAKELKIRRKLRVYEALDLCGATREQGDAVECAFLWSFISGFDKKKCVEVLQGDLALVEVCRLLTPLLRDGVSIHARTDEERHADRNTLDLDYYLSKVAGYYQVRHEVFARFMEQVFVTGFKDTTLDCGGFSIGPGKLPEAEVRELARKALPLLAGMLSLDELPGLRL